MRTAPRIIISLLLSLLLFSGLAVASYAGLFNILETRFYQPSVIKVLEQQLDAISAELAVWHETNELAFTAFTEAEAVKKSLLPNQSAQDIFDRENLAGDLLARTGGLRGIRIIDAGDSSIPENEDRGTRRIHFSTFKTDIRERQEFRISYELYGTKEEDIPFRHFSRADGSAPLMLIDGATDIFMYALPFYDAYATWRGTAVFYVSARAAVQHLASKGLLRFSDDLMLIGESGGSTKGSVVGMPFVGRDVLSRAVSERWASGKLETDRILSTDSGGWMLFTHTGDTWGFTGQLIEDRLFAFPDTVRILLLAITFITLFLIIFLMFNLRQDEMAIITSRIRRFQVHLLQEVMENGDESKWDELAKNLEYRRHDVNAEIKKSFGRRIYKKHAENIDRLLDKSWDEIISAISRQDTKKAAGIDTADIRLMLEQVLQNNAISLNLTGLPTTAKNAPPPRTALSAGPQTPAKVTGKTGITEEAGELGEVEELEDVDTVEELDEVEAVEELEDVDTVVELDEVEAVEELEDIDTVEELGEVEELEDIYAIEELDEVEELEDIDTVEELDEGEELEDIDTVEELGEVDELEDIDTVEELGEIEELEDIDSVGEIDTGESPVDESGERIEPDEMRDLEPVPPGDGDERALSVASSISTEPGDAPLVSFDDTIIRFNQEDTLTQTRILDTDLDFFSIDMDLYPETEDSFADLAPIEAEEVEYLDGEWEPELLEVASEEDLERFVEEEVPDQVLVYHFDEKPELDTGDRHLTEEEADTGMPAIDVGAPDFSSLDQSESRQNNEEDATTVDYIDYFLAGRAIAGEMTRNSYPVYEFLEVIGEEEPVALQELDAPDEAGAPESIVQKDGLFVISDSPDPADGAIDPEFKNLVDSVLG